MRAIRWQRCITLSAALALVSLAAAQTPVSPAFTYQGQLKDEGQPAEGIYHFRFSLMDAVSGGNQIGQTIMARNYQVSDGLFTVSLNEAGEFGPGAFNG